jgi:small subunit ribosomal protein S3Ae
MAKAKKVSKIKIKKKIWYKVLAPKLFGNKELGESYLTAPEMAIGRQMKMNLRELSGSMRDQNVHISFVIDKVEASTLKTSVTGYQLTNQYIKRAVRKNTARLDDYFTLKTKDNKKIIVKTLLVTLNRTQRSTKSTLRDVLGKLLAKEVAELDFVTFIANSVNHKMQISMKKKLSKIFPVKEVSFRVIKLVRAKKVAEPVAKETVAKAVEEAVEETVEPVAKAAAETAESEA